MVRGMSNWEKKSRAVLAWFLHARSRVPRIIWWKGLLGLSTSVTLLTISIAMYEGVDDLIDSK